LLSNALFFPLKTQFSSCQASVLKGIPLLQHVMDDTIISDRHTNKQPNSLFDFSTSLVIVNMSNAGTHCTILGKRWL